MNSFKAWLNFVGLLTIVSTSAEARSHTIATGQTTGTYYKVGQLLSEGNDSIEVVPTKGSEENLKGILKDTYQFGIVQSDVIYYSQGTHVIKPFQVIGALYYEPIYILVRSGLHLSGIGELRGKRVAVAVRREFFQLEKSTGKEKQLNNFVRGTIIEDQFLGILRRVRILLENQQIIEAKIHAKHPIQFQEHEQVKVRIDPESSRCFEYPKEGIASALEM